ncbi:KUP/HAK/KT family potassium transporter [Dyadobacter fermentans]|uniref:KUP/HAK/KT family potassium transporter n=1 Tax=Dyadobacter fermentans TaxID=94254 RepID=UPI001CBF6572|nr:KUP/HAK/KT family potassium transporter [Dyadobacter fermentans]MBZ1362714.1 KUP/HAK/KT family potassium transporter [Dyadobacter fermentans]
MEKQKNGAAGKVTAASLLVALGIIYGDIGTSPLYVLKAIVGDRPVSELLIYGGVSCVFWTITFQTTFKYIYLTLKADNNGEGGIFSLYALVRRYGKLLIIPTMLGASMLLADGIITPPISVSSAVEGLTNIQGLEHIPTVPIVLLILSVLFFFQRFGTHNVGSIFGPAMLVWFAMLSTLGALQIAQHPGIIKALSPVYALELLIAYPKGFVLLGAVFLATTGAEALYSDLGHCGRRNIRITWVMVKTCLMVNYMGQAAWLMNLGEGAMLDGRNPFFEIMPHWFLIIGILIATTAAIIASQAMISGSYTLISEAMNLNFWPRVAVRQPSEVKGQIYIPSVNYMLWIGYVLMVLYFGNSSNMEAAYGLAITITMMVTTYLLSYFLLFKLKWNRVLVSVLLLLFAAIEITFFIANIHKFPEGGYITILISAFYVFIMYSVYAGRKISNRFTKFVDLGEYAPLIQELSVDYYVPKFSTHLIYLTKANFRQNVEEKIIRSIFAKKPKRADVYWFVHLHRTEEPYTLSYDISELLDDKIIRVNINVGFRIQPRTELYFKRIVQELIRDRELNLHNRPDGSTKYNDEPDFKFVVIEKFLSVENEFTLREGVMLNAYFLLKRLGLSDEKAFGLDKSDVVIEHTPLIYQPASKVELRREQNSKPQT